MRSCKRCSRELAPEALVCDQCHTLVHADELEKLAARARAFESNGRIRDAFDEWTAALKLLPRKSKQAEWIRDHLSELNRVIPPATGGNTSSPTAGKWVKRLGPLAPLAILLAKGKTVLFAIFKLKFLLSFVAFMGIYWSLYGAKFGIGFAVLILVHEMGHFIDVKRRGLPAEMPVFLPGLGAYVRWQAMGVSLETRSAVSLAGPLAGLLGAAVCAAVWWVTGSGLWGALARASAWLNVMNLIPIWVLDGGHAVLALSRVERAALLVMALGLGLLLGEYAFYLVAAGALWRLFTKDLPAEPSRFTMAYFLLVLAGLGLVMWLVPGHGFGPR
ncbi:MAG TPA: site-2 protease family protein [Alphaproteobacteria bacterium]|nr:site-2 protease family protein [Alphaproteobacteria bacterium]